MLGRVGLIAALSLTAASFASAEAAIPETELAKPLQSYKGYVSEQVDLLVSRTRKFVEEIKDGNLAEAQGLYAPARQPYERIEPVAELFNDLDTAIDAREDDYERKSDDPKFTGFHRIEKVLFHDNTTKGLEATADKLLADVLELQKRLKTLEIKPKNMVGGAAALIEEVASGKITGEEDRYSRTDLWDFHANVDGAQKIVALLKPLLDKHNPELEKKVAANFKTVDTILDKYKVKDGFQSYDKLTEADRNALKGPITTLAEDLSTLRGVLGLS